MHLTKTSNIRCKSLHLFYQAYKNSVSERRKLRRLLFSNWEALNQTFCNVNLYLMMTQVKVKEMQYFNETKYKLCSAIREPIVKSNLICMSFKYFL